MVQLAARTSRTSLRTTQIVVELRRGAIFDHQLGDDIDALAALDRGALVDAGGAQHVRARPLHIFQIVGVIDDARYVRVLEIDAEREMVDAPDEGALIRPVEVCAHEGHLTERGLARKPQKTRRADFAFASGLASRVTLGLHISPEGYREDGR